MLVVWLLNLAGRRCFGLLLFLFKIATRSGVVEGGWLVVGSGRNVSQLMLDCQLCSQNSQNFLKEREWAKWYMYTLLKTQYTSGYTKKSEEGEAILIN